ncbi:hypothetical protein ACEQPO_21590 [Bacillus sp. SL00103]
MDGNSLAYRAFFALPLLSNDKGVHTNAIYGFAMILMKMLEDEKPTHMLVAFDAGKQRSATRHLKNIKAEDKKPRQSYPEQMPFIRELLDAYRVKNCKPQYEADDIIGTWLSKAEKVTKSKSSQEIKT